MMHSTFLTAVLSTFGLASLALVGCTPQGPPADGEQGLALRAGLPEACDVASYNVTVGHDQDGNDILEEGEIIQSANIGHTDFGDVSDLGLGDDDTAEDGTWLIADQFIVLEPNTNPGYDVNVTALDSAGNAVSDLSPSNPQAALNVQIHEGQTTELVFAFSCEGSSIGALDVVVLLNEGPSILDFEYEDDKFGITCEAVDMSATFDDPTGGPIDVRWTVFHEGANPDAVDPLYSESTTIDANAGEAYTTSFGYTCADGPGTYDVYLDVADEQGETTRVQALAHCYEPQAGFCFAEGDGTYRGGPWQGAGELQLIDMMHLAPETVESDANGATFHWPEGSDQAGDGTLYKVGTLTTHETDDPFIYTLYSHDPTLEFAPSAAGYTVDNPGFVLGEGASDLDGDGTAFDIFSDAGVTFDELHLSIFEQTLTGAGMEVLGHAIMGGADITLDRQLAQGSYGLVTCDAAVEVDEACLDQLGIGELQSCADACPEGLDPSAGSE